MAKKTASKTASKTTTRATASKTVANAAQLQETNPQPQQHSMKGPEASQEAPKAPAKSFFKSADTGLFVTQEFAEKNPETTYRHSTPGTIGRQ